MRILLPLASLLLVAAAPAANLSDAKALMADERYVEAEQVLSAVAEGKKTVEVLSTLAECRLKLGMLDEAKSACYDALDIDGKSADLWKLYGRIAFERGNYSLATGDREGAKLSFTDAENYYRKAMGLNPSDPDLLWMTGWALEQQGESDPAEKLYRQAIEQFPESPGGYRRLGVLLELRAEQTEGGMSPKAQELRQKAIDVFDQGLEKAGADAETLYAKGLSLEWMRKKSEAKDCYVEAIRTDPGIDKIWRRLSKTGYSADEFIALGKEVLKTHPQNPVATLWTAFYLTQSGQAGAAMPILLATLKKHPEARGVYDQALNTSFEVDRAKAVEVWRQLHEMCPLFGDAANNLALFNRDETKDVKTSIAWYQKALERDPQNQDYLNDLALMYLFYFKGPEQKKALPYFEQVVSLVQDEGYAPQRGYWDTLENLCKYYWDVEHDPKKVVKYAEMRYQPTHGVNPYNMSPAARQWGLKAKAELGE